MFGKRLPFEDDKRQHYGTRRPYMPTFCTLCFDRGASGRIQVSGHLVRVLVLGQKEGFFTPDPNREAMKMAQLVLAVHRQLLAQRHLPLEA